LVDGSHGAGPNFTTTGRAPRRRLATAPAQTPPQLVGAGAGCAARRGTMPADAPPPTTQVGIAFLAARSGEEAVTDHHQ
jgi:hypothetical protein